MPPECSHAASKRSDHGDFATAVSSRRRRHHDVLFKTFWTWLTARLTSYVSVHAAATAAAIEPVAVTSAVVYRHGMGLPAPARQD